MNISDLILNDREYKYNIIKEYCNDYEVVSLRANIPGQDKKIKEAYALLHLYNNLILESNPVLKTINLDGYDGPSIIYLMDKKTNYKSQALKLEEETKLGRFVDIDVYNSPRRENQRRCYLCGDVAFTCARTKKHSVSQLLAYISTSVQEELKEYIKEKIIDSINQELELEPKFGLVTINSNGSHNDMDYCLMCKARDAIVNDLTLMFILGYNNEKDLFNKIRNIGIETEKKMFQATNGVNAYLGLIFDLGIVLASFGSVISKSLYSNKLLTNKIKSLTKGLTKELVNNNIYQEYNITGARGEAEKGFYHVFDVLNKYDLETKRSKIEALIYLIINIEDTTLLRRCKDINTYNKVKEEFKTLKYNDKEIEELTNKCIENNLSFGGAADLLIVSFFIKSIYYTK